MTAARLIGLHVMVRSAAVSSCILALVAACASSHDIESRHDGVRGAGDAGVPSSDAGPTVPLSMDQIGQPVAAIPDMFQFPEGPVWVSADEALYFTDITGDAIYRLKLPDMLEPVMKPAGHPDGLALGPDGSIWVAGFGARNIWKLVNGERVDVVDTYQGQHFNSPDDVVLRSDGTAYFTDPTFGIDGTTAIPLQMRELSFEGVYRIDAQGELHLEDMSVAGPNGVRISPDEKTLFVSSTTRGSLFAYDIQADGSLSAPPRVWNNKLTGADSFCLDAQGNVYIATAFGIAIVNTEGMTIGTIPVSGLASNVGFGGADRRTLFITTRALISFGGNATGKLWRIDDMPIPGLAPKQHAK